MFEDVVQALQAWFDHYGHFDVPIDWQVPTHSCLREGVETELGALEKLLFAALWRA